MTPMPAGQARGHSRAHALEHPLGVAPTAPHRTNPAPRRPLSLGLPPWTPSGFVSPPYRVLPGTGRRKGTSGFLSLMAGRTGSWPSTCSTCLAPGTRGRRLLPPVGCCGPVACCARPARHPARRSSQCWSLGRGQWSGAGRPARSVAAGPSASARFLTAGTSGTAPWSAPGTYLRGCDVPSNAATALPVLRTVTRRVQPGHRQPAGN
jgi:hypothetical protein